MRISSSTHILLIALIIIITFSSSLKNDFAWDDSYLIIGNDYIKSWSYVPRIFSTQLYEGSGMHSNFYRPLQLLSFMADYSLWELNPFGYHLTSLLLHIFNSILVYLVAATVICSLTPAFITSLLFGLAPSISGITYYIPARSDLLMAYFMLLSILLFTKYREKKKFFLHTLSVIFFIFSLLSKEMAVILPILLVIMGRFTIQSEKKDLLKSVLPYLIVIVIYGYLRGTVLNFAKGSNSLIDLGFPATIPLPMRILTDFKIILQYLRILLFPLGLHIEWFVAPAKTILSADILLSIAFFTALVFVIIKLSHRYRPVLFGALWFLLALLPVLNIYPVSVFFGEGWLYIPSIGFFIVFSVLCQKLIGSRAGKVIGGILIASFLSYYAGFTISYGKVWKDSISLFHNVVRYEGKSPFIHLTYNNLGMAYYNKGEFTRSIEYSKKSISSNPRYPEAYNNLGVTYMAIGQPVKAVAYFKKAVSLNKNYTAAYRNLAHAYTDIGLKDKAMRFSEAVFKMNPYSYQTYCNMGYIFSDKGEIGKAIEAFKKAKDIRRLSYESYYAIGSLYMKEKRLKESLYEYEEALKLGLKDYKFYNEIAQVYIKNSDFVKAEKMLLSSLILNSNQPEPYNNLGNLYSMLGYFKLAIEEYRKALGIDPENLGILSNVKKTKREWKEALRKNAYR